MKYLKYIITLSIIVLFFWLAFKDFTQQDIESLWKTLKEVNLVWVVITICILGLSNILRAWRWRFLFSKTAVDLKLNDFYHATMIGYAINLVLPRVGEISKSVYLAKKTKIGVEKVLASVIVERILDSLLFAMFFAVTSFLFRDKLYEVFGEIPLLSWSFPIHIFSIMIMGLTTLFLVIFTLMVFFPKKISQVIERLFAVFSKKLAIKINTYFGSFLEGAAALKETKQYSITMLSSFGIWGMYFLGTLFPFYAMSFDQVYDLGALEALTTMSMSAFGQLITPAGAGTYQYICQNVLSRLFNVELSQASAFALLVFSITLITYGSLGAFSLLWQSKELKTKGVFNKDIALNKS